MAALGVQDSANFHVTALSFLSVPGERRIQGQTNIITTMLLT
jgi:hypothetical protein